MAAKHGGPRKTEGPEPGRPPPTHPPPRQGLAELAKLRVECCRPGWATGWLADETKDPMRSSKRRLGFFGGLLVVLLGAGAANAWTRPPVRSQVQQSVSRQPLPFTELYFSSPSALPALFSPSGSTEFEFSIRNHERMTTTYRYVVTGRTRDASQSILSGDVTVAVGGVTTVSVEFIPAEVDARYVITVDLAGRTETIHFATHS